MQLVRSLSRRVAALGEERYLYLLARILAQVYPYLFSSVGYIIKRIICCSVDYLWNPITPDGSVFLTVRVLPTLIFRYGHSESLVCHSFLQVTDSIAIISLCESKIKRQLQTVAITKLSQVNDWCSEPCVKRIGQFYCSMHTIQTVATVLIDPDVIAGRCHIGNKFRCFPIAYNAAYDTITCQRITRNRFPTIIIILQPINRYCTIREILCEAHTLLSRESQWL